MRVSLAISSLFWGRAGTEAIAGNREKTRAEARMRFMRELLGEIGHWDDNWSEGFRIAKNEDATDTEHTEKEERQRGRGLQRGLRRGEGSELGDFGGGEGAELAGEDVEFEGAELDALDFFDVMADVVKHAADLAIAAFDEDDFVPGIGGVFEKTDFCGSGFDAATVFEGDSDAVAETL